LRLPAHTHRGYSARCCKRSRAPPANPARPAGRATAWGDLTVRDQGRVATAGMARPGMAGCPASRMSGTQAMAVAWVPPSHTTKRSTLVTRAAESAPVAAGCVAGGGSSCSGPDGMHLTPVATANRSLAHWLLDQEA